MLDWLFDIAERLPKWSLPAVFGAIALGCIVSLRLVFVLPALFTEPAVVGEALVVVMVAAAGGAAGGLVYSLLGRPLLKVPEAGPYLTGIVMVAGYLGVLAILIPYVNPDAPRFFGSPAGVISFVICVLIFGIAIGRSWFTGADSLAADISIHPVRKQSPAEFRRARIERRRLAKSAAEQADEADVRRSPLVK